MGPAANLSADQFSGLDLSSLDLEFVVAIASDFENDNLTRADFTDANFSVSNLTGVDFFLTDLYGVNFTGTNLTGERSLSSNAPVFGTITWNHTTCPDGTNSDDDNHTCASHTSADSSRGQTSDNDENVSNERSRHLSDKSHGTAPAQQG